MYTSEKKLKRQHLDYLLAAKNRDFNYNGQNIKIYEWGNGPKKVLFVHGWQSHSFRWKKYIEAFSKEEYTLIAFDAPAHGLSEGKQFTVPLNAYLMVLLARDCHGFDAVVTHSIGSFSFFYAMAKYKLPPIGKLVAMASPGKASEFFGFYIEALKLKPATVSRIIYEFQNYVKEELENLNLSAMVENLIHIEKNSQLPFSIFKGQKTHEDDVILAAQEYLEKYYDQKITVDSLAERFGLGWRTLERRFKQATTNTIVEYMQRIKIEADKKQLESGRITVSEIMFEVGYNDPKAFREVFKKYTDMSPLDYKLKYSLNKVDSKG